MTAISGTKKNRMMKIVMMLFLLLKYDVTNISDENVMEVVGGEDETISDKEDDISLFMYSIAELVTVYSSFLSSGASSTAADAF